MLIYFVFCVTIGIVYSDDSFRIGVCKLNSTTESSLWILFYCFIFILQLATINFTYFSCCFFPLSLILLFLFHNCLYVCSFLPLKIPPDAVSILHQEGLFFYCPFFTDLFNSGRTKFPKHCTIRLGNRQHHAIPSMTPVVSAAMTATAMTILMPMMIAFYIRVIIQLAIKESLYRIICIA